MKGRPISLLFIPEMLYALPTRRQKALNHAMPFGDVLRKAYFESGNGGGAQSGVALGAGQAQADAKEER